MDIAKITKLIHSLMGTKPDCEIIGEVSDKTKYSIDVISQLFKIESMMEYVKKND